MTVKFFWPIDKRNYNLTTDLQTESFPFSWEYVTYYMELRRRNNTVVYLLEARPEQIKLQPYSGESHVDVVVLSTEAAASASLSVSSWSISMSGLSLAHLSTLSHITSEVSGFVHALCGSSASPEERWIHISKTELFKTIKITIFSKDVVYLICAYLFL